MIPAELWTAQALPSPVPGWCIIAATLSDGRHVWFNLGPRDHQRFFGELRNCENAGLGPLFERWSETYSDLQKPVENL